MPAAVDAPLRPAEEIEPALADNSYELSQASSAAAGADTARGLFESGHERPERSDERLERVDERHEVVHERLKSCRDRLEPVR